MWIVGHRVLERADEKLLCVL